MAVGLLRALLTGMKRPVMALLPMVIVFAFDIECLLQKRADGPLARRRRVRLQLSKEHVRPDG